ncbi:MAG TPA: hypothetical protein VHY19_06295 [Steroidobacteraceae bacterium]|jgi:hypothetical protein|nr:hypothetical protein [Steroidobacteraceae bacterium]
MSTLRAGQPGATRLCPHCKATVLESASICPGCRHHLRFSGGRQLAEESYTALSVDGTIAHRASAEPCEYCIVLDISNERGEQVMRQVVGVGALQPGELRRLNLAVQMLPLVTQVQPRTSTGPSATAAAAAPRPSPAQTPAAAAATGASASPPGAVTRAPGSPVAPAIAATASTGRPATPAPAAAAGSGTTAKPSTSAPPTAAAAAPARPSLQPPGMTQSQRLRIFRKP